MKVLDLYITKVCNLDCEYCYVEVVKKEGEVFSPGNFMEQVNLLEYNSIKFLGGEPLIRWKQIQEIVDAVKAKNKKIQFTIVTNGVLIDAKKIPYILENNIEVLVSIHEGSFPFLKKNYTLLQKIRDNICFYIIFDPTNFSTAFRNFLFFFQREFWNFSFAPEIYGDWNDENVKKFKKILDILLPYIKKNNINISGIDPQKLKVLNRGCEKTVYDEKGIFSACNRFKSLEKKGNFRYSEAYNVFDAEISYDSDPKRWFYICPVGWYLDHEGSNINSSIQSFKKLNHIFIDFFKKIYDDRLSFLTEDIQEIRFNLTQQCNLRCNYCYVDFKDEVLDYAVGKNIIDFFLEQTGNLKKISFFGGEPMLEFELLEKLVTYAEKKGSSLGKKLEYSIATNFTLLSQKRIDFLHSYNFNIHISLNGNKENNDLLRDNSSNIVFTNIKKYFTKEQAKNICILFAFTPNNIQDIGKNLEFLIEEGMVYFNLEMVFGKQYIWKKIDIERAVQYIRQVQQKYPDIHFANTENKSTYLDINTDGVCSDNSLVFHNKSLQKEMKQVFDSKIEEYLNKR